MSKRLHAVLLGLGAAAFLFIGLAFLVQPASMGDMVNISPVDGTARIELRAMYGGLEIGIGLFLVACLLGGRFRTGLQACAYAFGGLALGRFGGILLEGGTDPIHWLLVAFETVGFVLAVVGVRSLPRPNSAQ